MNKPNPSLIRQCMVEYANQLGRPHFEVCVVKRVVKSFATGIDDVFKPAIQKKAHFELARWADIYADLNKVMK